MYTASSFETFIKYNRIPLSVQLISVTKSSKLTNFQSLIIIQKAPHILFMPHTLLPLTALSASIYDFKIMSLNEAGVCYEAIAYRHEYLCCF